MEIEFSYFMRMTWEMQDAASLSRHLLQCVVYEVHHVEIENVKLINEKTQDDTYSRQLHLNCRGNL